MPTQNRFQEGGARLPRFAPQRWWRLLVRVHEQAAQDHISLVSAGVAFYGMLSLFPALAAFISIYGLVVDPLQVQAQLEGLGSLPQQARDILADYVRGLASHSHQTLGIGLATGVVLALWSASAGVKSLMTAINIAYRETEKRGFLRVQALGLALTLGVVCGAITVAAVVTAAAALLGPWLQARWLVAVLPWIVLLPGFVIAVSALYRWGPSRDVAHGHWITAGSLAATLLWMLASVGFSLYVAHFGNYEKTYGALGGIVVLLLWLWVLAYAVLLGAELNAELEDAPALGPR